MTLQKVMVFQASFCFVLLSHAISGTFAVDSQNCTFEENLALGKKTIQSSVYNAWGSNLAVDGNRDANLSHGSCTHTDAIAPTWWAVDLGQKTSVGRVTLTSRDDLDTQRFQQFFIALTDVSPWISAPKLNESSICTYYYGIPAPGFPLNIFCDPTTRPGRYLFLFMKRAEYLNLCELEVYYK